MAKRNLHGSRMWWVTCTCRKFLQGCFAKDDAEQFADRHRKEVQA